MAAMSTRERIMSVYRNRTPDRIPLAAYSRYVPRGAHERACRNLGLGIIDYYPPVSLLAPPWHLNPGHVSDVKDVTFRVAYAPDNGEMVETRSYETPVGTVYQEGVKDPAYGSDWIRKYYIASREDYKVVQYIVERTVFRRQGPALRERMVDLGDDGVLMARMDRCPYQKLLIELAGPDRLLTDLMTEPEPALELMNAMEIRMDEAFEMAMDCSAEVIWQPDNVTVDMTPPAFFKRHCIPWYHKHAEQAHRAGKVYVVHMDGRLSPLKALIAESPLDAVESFSLPQIGGDMGLAEALAAWPGKVILPNFPSSLCYRTRKEIEARLQATFTEAGDRPFMLQVSEDIPRSHWQETLETLCSMMPAGRHPEC